ncbi:MAG: DUF3048 domain-containing protein [Actinobacteria bacterium]|nr:DUF3048 domain-containing protein [Actinomycetota bacterium]NIS30220.1 DUF3048 domain-containing protein [Actinomycetota bacterium]NIT94930.1 DUF3048 domain-containing protein [Actinomycetota bacterium]NIU18599.1 DUF3048 domain-containing protein [Actinomycetota bacterium]NIU65468.1 DUF3048 domain-containing protein [Actinomycetota bacterium]
MKPCVGTRSIPPALVLLFALVVAACGGAASGEVAGGGGTSTTTSSTSTSSTTTPGTGPPAPLTGEAVDDATLAARSALVVKIGNNDAKSIPQTGLAEADLVYEEYIEGQKTRLAAVFHSEVPAAIGPVRSGRLSDIDLVADLGTPSFAYSGGNPTVLRQFLGAFEAGAFVDVGELRLESLYVRAEARSRPDNLYLSADQVDLTQGSVPVPLFTYGPLPAGMGADAAGVEVRYPTSFGRSSVHIWDGAAGGWVRLQDEELHTTISGEAEIEIAPPNVVVAVVRYVASEADPSQSPRAESNGTGPVFVLTQGRMVEGTWTRGADGPGWTLADAGGRPIPLAPGATWVLLAAAEGSAFGDAAVTHLEPVDAAERLAEARAEFAESSAE